MSFSQSQTFLIDDSLFLKYRCCSFIHQQQYKFTLFTYIVFYASNVFLLCCASSLRFNISIPGKFFAFQSVLSSRQQQPTSQQTCLMLRLRALPSLSHFFHFFFPNSFIACRPVVCFISGLAASASSHSSLPFYLSISLGR